jgi:SARP family transcriptional regulator, regulator of embCAB operon
VRVHLLGRLTVAGPESVIDERDLPGAQGRLAFAFLTLERRPVSRDELAATLWPRQLPAGWSTGLNAVISKVRSSLRQVGVPDLTVTSSGGTVEAVLPRRAWIDLEDAVRRLDRAAGAMRRGDRGVALPEATAASAVLRRPFLPGIDSLWADEVRRRLEGQRGTAYELLADGWNGEGDHRLAELMARAAIALDPLRERGHRLLMVAQAAQGNLGSALGTYERCARLLEEELGTGPSDATRRLADRIRAGETPLDG